MRDDKGKFNPISLINLMTKLIAILVVWISVFCLIKLSISSAFSQKKDSPVVIKDVRVFDGERVISQATVIIASGRVKAVGKNITQDDSIFIANDAVGYN